MQAAHDREQDGFTDLIRPGTAVSSDAGSLGSGGWGNARTTEAHAAAVNGDTEDADGWLRALVLSQLPSAQGNAVGVLAGTDNKASALSLQPDVNDLPQLRAFANSLVQDSFDSQVRAGRGTLLRSGGGHMHVCGVVSMVAPSAGRFEHACAPAIAIGSNAVGRRKQEHFLSPRLERCVRATCFWGGPTRRV